MKEVACGTCLELVEITTEIAKSCYLAYHYILGRLTMRASLGEAFKIKLSRVTSLLCKTQPIVFSDQLDQFFQFF